MAIRTALNVWTATLFTTLGLSPLVACGGKTAGEGPRCQNPKTHLGPDGKPTGLLDCEGGSTARVEPVECGSALPRPEQCVSLCDPSIGNCSCSTDADCTDRPNGYCGTGMQLSGCYCNYGCTKDADCGTGALCLCGDPVGYCVSATCTGRSDCGGGTSECLSYVQSPGCPGVAFACQTAEDTCSGDADCAGGSQCSLVGSARHCSPMGCVVGRPFLVGGAALVAGVVRREDWASVLVPRVDALDTGTREMLARHWTEIGLMEHASIAAFARFALDALSLGAPPALLVATHAAMADETVHARDAFALASAYAGAPVGPGPLAIDQAQGARSPLDIVETAFLEGCIGETVAAVEASEALIHATDPAVREALARVSLDETRHAELAWRFLQWVLESRDGALSEAVRTRLVAIAEVEALRDAALHRPRAPSESNLVAHGMLGDGQRREIRRRVLAEIILPCTRSLAATRTRHTAGPLALTRDQRMAPSNDADAM